MAVRINRKERRQGAAEGTEMRDVIGIGIEYRLIEVASSGLSLAKEEPGRRNLTSQFLKAEDQATVAARPQFQAPFLALALVIELPWPKCKD